jgi:hypothetical protein
MPARLRRYDRADWPTPPCHPECEFWEAVEEWREAHPYDPNDDTPLELVEGPDVPFHREWLYGPRGGGLFRV